MVVDGYNAKSQCHGITFPNERDEERWQPETATVLLFGYSL